MHLSILSLKQGGGGGERKEEGKGGERPVSCEAFDLCKGFSTLKAKNILTNQVKFMTHIRNLTEYWNTGLSNAQRCTLLAEPFLYSTGEKRLQNWSQVF